LILQAFFICNESYVNVVNQLSNYLFSGTFLALSRAHKKDFSRTSVLGFTNLVACMLGGFTSKVQFELDTFFANLANRADLIRIVSAQAFAQARMKITDKALPHLNDHFLHLAEQDFKFPTWYGFRVVAADATVLRLTQQFITAKGKKAVRHILDAIGFALYLPGLEMTLAATLYLPTVGEREMLMNHLDKLRPNDILVLDRGYPANWLIAALLQRGIHFCMRADGLNFGVIQPFRRSGLPELIVTLPAPSEKSAQPYGIVCKPSTVRLVRQVFGNEVRVLITSLLDLVSYPAAAFSALYHSRWRIEEAFKRIKHRLSLEHTSGLTWLAAQQDFAAKILCDNINALAVYAAADTLDANARGHYIINRADAFVQIKRTLGRWLVFGLDALENIDTVFSELVRNLVRVKPNRSYPRIFKQKPHKSHAYK
jgi:hypothetical protein